LKPLLFALGTDFFADAVFFATGFALVFEVDFEAADALLLALSTRLGALNGRLRFFEPSEGGRDDAIDCERSGKRRSVYFIANSRDYVTTSSVMVYLHLVGASDA
jgi:hypothetical protein